MKNKKFFVMGKGYVDKIDKEDRSVIHFPVPNQDPLTFVYRVLISSIKDEALFDFEFLKEFLPREKYLSFEYIYRKFNTCVIYTSYFTDKDSKESIYGLLIKYKNEVYLYKSKKFVRKDVLKFMEQMIINITPKFDIGFLVSSHPLNEDIKLFLKNQNWEFHVKEAFDLGNERNNEYILHQYLRGNPFINIKKIKI